MINNYKLKNRLHYLSLTLFLAFIIKYNYLMLQVFYAPSITALTIRNLFFVIFYLKFIEPLLISKKIRQRLFFMLFIFTFFFVVNYWYNRYFGNFLSINDIFAGEGTGTFSMYQVLFTHIFKFRDLLIILDLALLGLFGFNSLADLKLTDAWGLWEVSYRTLAIKDTTIFILIILIFVIQIFAGSLIMGQANPAELYQSSSSYLASVYGILPVYAVEAYSYFHRS